MLLELAIGDAYGAGFEYVSRKLIDEHNDLSAYVQHPRHESIAPGEYTDDTQMTLAIAEAIVAGDSWTPDNLAARFVDVFKRNPREGYASRFYAFLHTMKDGADFLARIQPTSDKSGAAMRAAPIGVFRTVPDVLERARVQAAITHNTPDGIAAAQAAALLSHYFLADLGEKATLGKFIEQHVDGEWSVPWEGKVGGKGLMSVRAAITAVQRHDTLSALLRACIDFGGDVDTVATIALGAASSSREVTNDLPQPLVDGLENGVFGRDYLIDLDAKLLALAP